MLKRILLTMLISLVPVFSLPGEDDQGERAKPNNPQSHAQPAPVPKAETALSQTPGSAAGVVVFIDPNTKAIRQPTPAEIEELFGLTPMTAPFRSYPTIMGPGGAVGVKLDDSSLMYMIGTRTADGGVKTDCVTGDAAGRIRGNTPATPQRPAAGEKPPEKK